MDEAEQLRAVIHELFALMDTLLDRESDRALAEACGEAIAARLDRLEVLEQADRRTL
jgi:hypothetical protein